MPKFAIKKYTGNSNALKKNYFLHYNEKKEKGLLDANSYDRGEFHCRGCDNFQLSFSRKSVKTLNNAIETYLR